MNGATHRIGGMATGAAIPAVMTLIGSGNQLSTPQVCSIIAGAAIGSLLPDIDHQGSLIGRKVKLVSTAVRKMAGHRGATHYLVGLLSYAIGALILMAYISRWIHESDFALGIGVVVGIIYSTSMMFVVREVCGIIGKRIFAKQTAIMSAVAFIGGLGFTLYDAKATLVLISSFLIGSVLGYASHLLLDSFTVSGLQLFKPFSDFTLHLGHCRTGSDWHNHKKNDTAEDRKKAKGFGEAAYRFACICILVLNVGITFGVNKLF